LVDSVFDLMFCRLGDSSCGFFAFGGGLRWEFEAQVVGFGREETFLYGFGCFEGEDVD